MAISSKERRTATTGSATDVVVHALREDIIAGRLSAGMPLRQDELAHRYGTSRIPVREALRQLKAEGLVSHSPNKGATVSSLSTAEVIEILEVRIALECHALRLAVPKMIDTDIQRAQLILEEYDRSPDPAKWSEMNWRFHYTLYEPCDVQRLLTAIKQNFDHFDRFTRVRVSKATGKEQPQREHAEILVHCKSGDASAAARILAHHIQHTQRQLLAEARRQRSL